MKNLKVQISLLFKRQNFYVIMMIMVLLSVSLFFVNCLSTYGEWIYSVPAAKYLFLGSMHYNNQIPMIFSLIIPIVTVLPFADSFFEDREKHTVEYYLTRCDNNQYYYSKLFVVFLSGAIVMFVPLVINYLLNFIAFPLDSYMDFTRLSADQTWIYRALLDRLIMFKNLMVSNPYVYLLLHIVLFSVAGGLMAVVGFQISFFYKKSRIKLVCAFFIIYHLYSMILDGIGITEFDFSNYLFAYSSGSTQSIRGAVFTWSALVLAAFLPIPFAKRKLNDVSI